MKKQWYQNGKRIITDGRRILCDECPCGCPDFEGRTICYVDKNVVGGTGDGSSWANAYTSIQDAIDAHPKKEIQIQGYGESDCYPAGIILAECVYLKGVDDVWIDGETASINGITGTTTTRVDSISIERCRGIFFFGISEVNDCFATGVPFGTNGVMFSGCTTLDNCSAIRSDTKGFSGCINTYNCSAEDCNGTNFDFLNNSTPKNAVGCSVTQTDRSSDAFFGQNVTFVNCTASSNGDNSSSTGFYLNDSTLTNCTASGHGRCGFYAFGVLPNTYIGCSDIGNCWLNLGDCTPYGCDTV